MDFVFFLCVSWSCLIFCLDFKSQGNETNELFSKAIYNPQNLEYETPLLLIEWIYLKNYFCFVWSEVMAKKVQLSARILHL